MKRYVKESAILGAESAGTTFYKITINQLIETFTEVNVWIRKSFQELGFDAIDFEHNLFGSKVISNDVMYLCVTDGADIEIRSKGKTSMENPEYALDYYNPEYELASYVQDATPEIISEHITEYEISTPMFDKWAIDLIKEGYTFTDLMTSAQEYWFNE